MSAGREHDAHCERLELVLEAAGLDLWENDLVTGEVPRKATKVLAELGYGPDEASRDVGEIFQLIHPDDVPAVTQAVERHVRGETAQYRSEFRLRAKSGAWVWYANYGRVMDRRASAPGGDAGASAPGVDCSAGARGRRLIGVTFNIDERKRLENRLAELADLNQKTLALSSVGVLTYKVESGRCALANDAIAAIVGGTVEQLLQQNFREIASWRASGLLQMAEEVLQGYGRQRMGVHLYSTFGKEAWVDVTMTSFVSHGERCLLVMMDDVTEHKRALEALCTARDRAEQASRAKSAFLANMSHEIRTPMNTILGMVQLALRNERDPGQRDYLVKIQQSGEHLLGIIDDLLDFSRIDAGKLALDEVGFEIAQVRQALLDQFEWRAAEKQLQFGFELEAGIPERLSGDMLRLNQVLINLVSNALKFTASGAVAVSARRIGEDEGGVMLRFEVRDTGAGIDPAHREKLFSPFFQHDASITRRYGGSGLGLAISRRLVEMMGGQIGVESTPGRGSTFWFTARFGKVRPAPAKPHGHSAREMQALGAAVAALNGARILLAEDHAFNQQVALEFLKDAGAAVCIANNGEEALDLLRNQPFDCVLMDVQMPVLDGLQAARQIRADPELAAMPIIALTANVLGEDRQRCLAAGMNDFIGKPFRVAEFYGTLAAALAGRTSAVPGEA